MATAPRAVNWRSLTTIVSVMILVGAEVFGVALAAGWALAGLFGLGTNAGYAFMALFSALGAYAMLMLWRRATAVEPVTL